MQTDNILLALVAITGAMVLLQFIVLAALALVARKAVKEAKTYGDELRNSVLPVLDSSREFLRTTRALLDRIEPKVESAASNIAEMTQTANAQTKKIQQAADEITERLHHQAVRIDDMTTSALNGVDRATHFLNEAVRMPARQFSGVVAAAKAVVETLRSPSSRPRSRPDDEHQARYRAAATAQTGSVPRPEAVPVAGPPPASAAAPHASS